MSYLLMLYCDSYFVVSSGCFKCTNNEIEEMKILLKNKEICELFSLKTFSFKDQIKKYALFQMLIAGQRKMEKSLVQNIKNKIKKELPEDSIEKIGDLALLFVFGLEVFFNQQAESLGSLLNVGAEEYKNQARERFLKDNQERYFRFLENKVEKTLTSRNLPYSYEKLNYMKVGETQEINGKKIILLEVLEEMRKVMCHKTKLIYIDNIDPEEVSLFVYSFPFMKNEDELQKKYGENVTGVSTREISSETGEEDEKQILLALENRKGNCFCAPLSEKMSLVIILEEAYEADVKYESPELTEDQKNFLLKYSVAKVNL